MSTYRRTRGLVASGPHFIQVGPAGPYFMYVTSHPLNPKIELARPMSFHPSIYATRCPPCAGRCETKLGPRRFLSAVEMADNSSGVKSHLPNVDAVEDELELRTKTFCHLCSLPLKRDVKITNLELMSSCPPLDNFPAIT